MPSINNEGLFTTQLAHGLRQMNSGEPGVRFMKLLLLSLFFAIHAQSAALSEKLQINTLHSQLAALPAELQTSVLGKVATRVGYSCVGTRSMFQGFGTDGTAWWSIECANGDRYSIEVGKDMRVRLCSVFREVARVDCFVRF